MVGKVSAVGFLGAFLAASVANAGQLHVGTRGTIHVGGRGPTIRPVVVARPVVVGRPAPVVVAQAAPVVIRPTVVVGAPVYYPPPPPQPQPVYVDYRPPPPPPQYVEYRDRPAPYTKPYRAPSYMDNNQMGLNLNIQSAALSTRSAPTTGLLGIGASLRYRPIPWLGLEAGLGAFAGRDFNYDTRNEITGQGNIYGYINPQSPLQLYVLAGVHYTSARVGDGYGQTLTTNQYIGAQAGAGLELRVSRHFALGGDLRGIVRTRTDSDILFATGSRTSGGLMGTVGMTVYF